MTHADFRQALTSLSLVYEMGDASTGLVVISWPKHHEELVSGLWNFYNTKYRVDFDVKWSGRSIRAHQLILDVFLPPERLDRRALTDKRSNLDSLLEFMYRGRVAVRREELDNLRWTARKLGFKMLADAVELARRGSGDGPANRRQRRSVNPDSRRVGPADPIAKSDPAPSDVPSESSVEDVSEWHGIIEALRLDWETSAIPTSSCSLEASSTPTVKPVDLLATSTKETKTSSRKPTYVDADGSVISAAEYMRLYRQRQRLVRCTHCSYSTRDRRYYGAHFAKHHPGVPVPTCAVCQQTFFDRESLTTHLSKVHLMDEATCADTVNATLGEAGCTPPPNEGQTDPPVPAPLSEAAERQRIYRRRQKLVRCDHCDDYQFRDKRHYCAHLVKHHPGVPVPRCPICRLTFYNMRALARHKLNQHLTSDSMSVDWSAVTGDSNSSGSGSGAGGHHPVTSAKGRKGQPPVKCALCNYETADKQSFAEHLVQHGVPVPTCPVCSLTFFDLESLLRHRTKRHPETLTSIDAIMTDSVEEHCGGGVGRADDRLQELVCRAQHVRAPIRPNRQLVRCNLCDYETQDRRYYAAHLCRYHPDVAVSKCDSCGRPFPDEESLVSHQLKYANGGCVTAFRCRLCPYETPASINLYRHLYTRHGVNAKGKPVVRKHKCLECSYSALIPSQLKSHMLAKHSGLKPFKCQRCSYATYHKGARDNHVRKVHEGLKPYLCDTCGHRSASQCNLDRHRRTHTGERPFPCTVSGCGQAFADRHALNGHLQSKHTAERPYVCHVCAHAFRRMDTLRTHLKKIHHTR